MTEEDSRTEGTRNDTKQTVTMTAPIDHVVAQSLLDSFQPVTTLAPGGVLKDVDADQRSRLEAEKQNKKEAADAARLAKRELATNKAAVFKPKMPRDLGTCEVCLRELEAASVNKDTKKDYTKRFLKHQQGLVKIGKKINTTGARDDNRVCRSLLKEAEAQVLALKDSCRAWKKVKQAALLWSCERPALEAGRRGTHSLERWTHSPGTAARETFPRQQRGCKYVVSSCSCV